MGIPPESVGLAAAEIFIADIQPAHKADISVNHDDFTVIPVVDPAGEKGSGITVGRHLNSGIA
ncbi:hypothetical protein D3C74_358930 [compost metagenome]